jgi:pyruvate dehydrogenase E2 component (dihydrolipoamide acetyltransferase)
MTDVTMPKLSMNMSRGVVSEWLVEDGDAVEAGQDLLEVESEKAASVVEAPAGGTVELAVEAGSEVAVGSVLATIGEAAESGPGDPAEPDGDTDASASTASGDETDERSPAIRATPSARRAAREAGVELDDVAERRQSRTVTRDDVDAYVTAGDDPSTARTADEDPETARTLDADPQTARTADADPQTARTADAGPQTARTEGGVRASPAARQAARSREVDLAAVDGSGPEGAVIRRDVEAAANAVGTTAAEASTPPSSSPTPVRDRQKLSGVRETIAERLGRSWRTAPQVTIDREIDVGAVVEFRKQLNAESDPAVAFDDVFLLAAATALERHPDFNATLEDERHVRYDRADIALAVDTERGLLSPVIRSVGEKDLTALAAERAELVERTREGTVEPHRLAGGTFTITNLGPFDVDSFTPIVNPPQVAILGVGTVRRAPREAADGSVEFRDVLTASLSFDHRAVDGADAARFLDTIADLLERPAALVVD